MVVLFFLLYFAPMLIGLVILIFAARYASRRISAALWGFAAALLMLVQFVLLAWAADFNGTFNGQTNYSPAKASLGFSMFCLLTYFVFTGIKFNRKKSEH